MKVNIKTNPQPVREEINGEYVKGNPMRTIPITYTTNVMLVDGFATRISLARRRYKDTTPQFEPTLMSVEIDELDGLIQLLTDTRDVLQARGLITEYKRS